MYFIDTHCHLDKETMEAPLEIILSNCAEHNVNQLLCAGFNLASSAEGISIAENNAAGIPRIWAAAGIHPHDAADCGMCTLRELEKMLCSPRVLALGEIGLDFFYDNSPRGVQRTVFCEQIDLAVRMKKPIITHIRDAKERQAGDANKESINLLREGRADKVGGIIHCFSGDIRDADAAMEMGFYISFAGPVTYPKNDELREIAASIPLERVLCETDSPYLAPQKFRGMKNEPANVRFVYEQIAAVRGMDVESFAMAVAENVNRLFGLDENGSL